MRRFVLQVAFVVLAFMPACAPQSRFPEISPFDAAAEAEKQRDLVIEQRIAFETRLRRVGHPILVAGVPRCGDKVTRTTGAVVAHADSFGVDSRPAAIRVAKAGPKPTVIAAPPNTPAGRAGLKPGDQIEAIDGKPIVDGDDGVRTLSEAVKISTGSIVLDVRRPQDGGSGYVAVRLAIEPERVCDYPIQAKIDDQVNAFADGTKIIVTSGMGRFVDTDDELALVIGHELAHNTETHIAMKTGNVVIGGLIGAVLTGLTGVNMMDPMMQLGAGAFSQEFESEADYIGVYYAVQAGFDAKGAARFWRRMGVAHPQSIHLAGTSHPSTAKRFLAIEQTVAEIEKKRAEGKPLVPEKHADKVEAKK